MQVRDKLNFLHENFTFEKSGGQIEKPTLNVKLARQQALSRIIAQPEMLSLPPPPQKKAIRAGGAVFAR
jgi:hypothetical protein